MPNPFTRYYERWLERSAMLQQELAESFERLGVEDDLDREYEKAARAWRKAADAFSAKARRHALPVEGYTQAYACRAADAWLRVAQNYAKAATHAANPGPLERLAANAYREAAKMAEICATGHVERGELVMARAEYEQAQFCFERCGADADAARVGRLAERVLHALETGTLREN